MKKVFSLIAFLGMFLSAFSLFSADAKQIMIYVGSSEKISVPFKIENINISNKEVVGIDVYGKEGYDVFIKGLKVGTADVRLEGGKLSEIYNVTVRNNILEIFKALKKDLIDLSEIDMSVNNDRIVLKGEISNISNWVLKRKVVAAYGSIILDLTTYRPTPEVMLNLKENFRKAGFKAEIKGDSTKTGVSETAKPGDLIITQVGEMLTVTGSVYTPADLKKIDSILRAQPWLTMDSNPSSADDSAMVKGFVNVQVIPEMLQVDIVHIAVSKQDVRNLGIDWSEFVSNGFNVGANLYYALEKAKGSALITKSNSMAEMGTTNGTLHAWLSVLGQNGVNRARRAGFLTFKSNDTPEFRKLHNGGTYYLSSLGGTGTATVISELKEVEYGLILEVKGGLSGVDSVSIELKQELSYPSQNVYPQGVQFDLKKFSTTTSMSCKLGETIAIGGLKEFTQQNTNTASLPYLRNIPVFKWMLSQEGNTFQDDEIITLICVHKMVKNANIDPVAAELEKMAIEEKIAENKYNKENDKNKGKWYEFWRW